MFSPAVPSATLQIVTAVHQNAQQQQKSRSARPSFNSENGVWNYHVDVVRLLQGEQLNSDQRLVISESIRNLDQLGRADLIDFLASKNGAINSTLENNACKHFTCKQDELENVLINGHVTKLLDFWSFVQMQIIPNVSSALYPLQVAKITPDFQLRHVILATFRNKLLLPILENSQLDNEQAHLLRPILCAVCFAAADKSNKHEKFERLTDELLFNDEQNEIVIESKQTGTCISPKVGVRRSVEEIGQTNIDESHVEHVTKPRAKTLPKSVRWVIENGSVDI
ncbi:hypothetical protein M3Y98_00532600 [Aphelenchoides besseyi]|nr:hypothetical protein M3Y98_00532600 [Aphelenchoides besseyi]KAI6208059.1 hypothetical protein M3Y96_00074500 [Aphelenchoides besseyi]